MGEGMAKRWSPRARVLAAAGLAAAVAGPAVAVLAPVEVVQHGRAFSVSELAVEQGAVVRFTNADDYPHQIDVRGTGMRFDSDLVEAGTVTSVTFDKAGRFQVRCGIHPLMRMTVNVATGP